MSKERFLNKKVKATGSTYKGLIGEVLAVKTENKDTENEGADIYVSFKTPEDENLVKELESRFSALYGEPKTIDDLSLDLVIMSAEELEII